MEFKKHSLKCYAYRIHGLKCTRLFPKLQGYMRLLPNMRLIMKAKIDHTPKARHLYGSTCT